jgi:superfamily II DNA or RNA helicase
MSISTKIEDLTDDQRENIIKDLCIEIEDTKKKFFGANKTKKIYAYLLTNTHIYTPFYYSIKNLGKTRNARSSYSSINCTFTGALRDEQKVALKEGKALLNTNGCCIMSMYPGFGKTISAIKLACDIKLKTLIIVNKIILMDQWITSINDFCNSATIISNLKNNKKNLTQFETSDFIIMNAINIDKFPKSFYEDIGFVVVDECHQILTETLSRSLELLSPRYLLGLSATAFRYDPLDKLFNLYFGPEKVVRTMHKKHTVYVVKTGCLPQVEISKNGKINWSLLIDSLSMNQIRNEIIIDIITKHKDRNFLVLVKRIAQGEILENKLKEAGENVGSLLGSNQIFDRNVRILIGTNSKVGTGFNFEKINSLILACDLKNYFLQYLGRCFRDPSVEPYIYDLLDENHILKSHFFKRRDQYIQCGGLIRNYTL